MKTKATDKNRTPGQKNVKKSVAQYAKHNKDRVLQSNKLTRNDIMPVFRMDRGKNFTETQIRIMNVLIHPTACMATNKKIAELADTSETYVCECKNNHEMNDALQTAKSEAIAPWVWPIMGGQIVNAVMNYSIESAKFVLEYGGYYTPRHILQDDRFKGMRDKDINEEMYKKLGAQNVA